MSREEDIEEGIHKVLWAYHHGMPRHINQFFSLKAAPDMISSGLFYGKSGAKEITESMAAFNAVLRKLPDFDPHDPDVTVISIGDGSIPRTAGLCAFRTNWTCISIDPGLHTNKISKWEGQIRRLCCVPEKVEDVKFDELTCHDNHFNRMPINYKKVLLLAVHSHAPMKASLRACPKGELRSLVAIPCCVPYDYLKPTTEYRDSGIWSPKNRVMIWRGI